MKLYQEELMDHYRYPRNKGRLELPDFVSDVHNPSCGDSIEFQGAIAFDRLVDVAFQGKGCVISQATASLLSQSCKNQPLKTIKLYDAQFLTSLIAIQLGPNRLQCALLSLQALQQGIAQFQLKNS